MKYFVKTIVTVFTLIPLLSTGSGQGGSGAPDLGADYDVGKKVFYTRVICASCPYPDLTIPDGVAEIAPELKRGGAIGQYLSLKERRSVALFLEKQFDIKI